MKTVHGTLMRMIGELRELQAKHRLPYANDLWWRLGDAITSLERADESTPERRYGEDETTRS